MNINQTTPAKPNRKERRALERKMRKETKNPKTIVIPTNETGVLAVYVPVSEPKETPAQPSVKPSPTQSFLSDTMATQLKSIQFTLQEAEQTYSMSIEDLIKTYESQLQQQIAKAETAINMYHTANVVATELELSIESNSLDVDIKASQRNVEESKRYLQALLDEYKRRAERLVSSINKLDKAINTTPWTVSDDTINRFMKLQQKRLADLLVEKENRRVETARQAEINSLLARLKELGYDPDPIAETKPDEQPNENEFFVVERREEVIPVIAITLNNRQLSMTVDEACQKIKSWYASLPKHTSIKLWDQGYAEKDIVEYLKLIEQISFVKKKGRVDLFREEFDWSYSSFLSRFGTLLQKYNIKMWAKQKLTFDHR